MKLKRYSGAGILFVSKREGIDHALLGCRKKSKIWSIPGGGAHQKEPPWDAAIRETTEEFGAIPGAWERIFSLRFPFILFDWTTFVVRLNEIPISSVFPDRHAHDFKYEFCDAQWFPIIKLPPNVHYLLKPVLIKYNLQNTPSKSNKDNTIAVSPEQFRGANALPRVAHD
jgi:8-oxo-dGTP pyrophosphatase MutT (NUDIX family)